MQCCNGNVTVFFFFFPPGFALPFSLVGFLLCPSLEFLWSSDFYQKESTSRGFLSGKKWSLIVIAEREIAFQVQNTSLMLYCRETKIPA